MREAVCPVYVKESSPVPRGPDVTCKRGMVEYGGVYLLEVCKICFYYKLYVYVITYIVKPAIAAST